MKKGVIYTAVTGGYDDFRTIFYDDNFDYICFTDFNFGHKVPYPWKHIRLPPSKLNNKDLARYCKLNPHLLLPNYDISVWIDGNILIKKEIYKYVHSVLMDNEVASYEHWWRDETEQEFYACATQGFDLVWRLKKQYLRSKDEGYKSNIFFENNVIFRRHNNINVVKMQNIWWREYLKGGKRDQYSFTYAAFISNVEIFSLGKHDPRISKIYFDYREHIKKRPKWQYVKIIINRMYLLLFPWNVSNPKRENLLSK